ncbi:MAG: hypothetical protein K5695_09060 [Oscillospiraceae bacterium]|nr:hypothetical protein [Oscillospiraceae bacterium]
MEDLYERVYRYASEDAEGAWGYDWRPKTYEPTDFGGIAVSTNDMDERRVYVFECIYRKKGDVPGEAEEAKMLAEKEALADCIRSLHKELSEYTYPVDYCAVKRIVSGDERLGYDFVLRQKPYITLTEYLNQPEMAAFRDQLLNGTDEEAEKVRHDFTTRLLRHMVLGLKDIYRVGSVHGHIDPDAVWLEKAEQKKEGFRLSPPGYGFFLVSREENRETIDEYAAPELCLDPEQAFDLQTDLYAVGLVIYRYLNSGKAPFALPQITAADEHKRRRAGDTEIPAPRFGTSIMKYIVRKLLAYERDVRYSDFAELESDIRKLGNKVADYDPMSVETISHDRAKALQRTKEDNIARSKQFIQELEGILKELDIDEEVIKEELGKKGAQRHKLQDQLTRIEEGRKLIHEDIAKAQADIENPPSVPLPQIRSRVKTNYVQPMSATKDERDIAEAEEEQRRLKEKEERDQLAAQQQEAQAARDQAAAEQKQRAEEQAERDAQAKKEKEEELRQKIAQGRENRKGAIWWTVVGVLSAAALVLTFVVLHMLEDISAYSDKLSAHAAAEISITETEL